MTNNTRHEITKVSRGIEENIDCINRVYKLCVRERVRARGMCGKVCESDRVPVRLCTYCLCWMVIR